MKWFGEIKHLKTSKMAKITQEYIRNKETFRFKIYKRKVDQDEGREQLTLKIKQKPAAKQ